MEGAIARYREAMERHDRQPRSVEWAHPARHLGERLTEAGRLDEAEPILEEALAVYRDVHARAEASRGPGALDLANAVRPLALLRTAQERREDAVVLWREARELYEVAGIQAGVDECDANLGRLTGAEVDGT